MTHTYIYFVHVHHFKYARERRAFLNFIFLRSTITLAISFSSAMASTHSLFFDRQQLQQFHFSSTITSYPKSCSSPLTIWPHRDRTCNSSVRKNKYQRYARSWKMQLAYSLACSFVPICEPKNHSIKTYWHIPKSRYTLGTLEGKLASFARNNNCWLQ